MSYGFYKLPPRSSHEDYIIKVAGKTTIAIGIEDGSPMLQTTRPVAVAVVSEVETQAIDFREQGYSGDVCTNCQGVRLRWAGHCQVCDDCGTTTGCS